LVFCEENGILYVNHIHSLNLQHGYMQGRAWAEKAYLTLKHAMKNVAEAKSSYAWLPSCGTVKPPKFE